MEKKIRKYWSGRLHPGDIVIHNGIKCKVAGYVEEKNGPVPAGHVPIFCHSANGREPVYTVPLDDIEIHERFA